jgi:ERCC4-type nuclease
VTGARATEAHDLLRKFGGVSAIIAASDSEMAALGITTMTARRIRAFQEAAAASHWRKLAKRTALSSWNDLLD